MSCSLSLFLKFQCVCKYIKSEDQCLCKYYRVKINVNINVQREEHQCGCRPTFIVGSNYSGVMPALAHTL
jgi:hypothetical protein